MARFSLRCASNSASSLAVGSLPSSSASDSSSKVQTLFAVDESQLALGEFNACQALGDFSHDARG
jgi:hypothetical protein